MKKIRLSLFLLCYLTIVNAYSQSISNTDFTVSGNQIIVTYDLNADATQEFDITLYISRDNGSTWQGPLSYVTGNVGEKQTSGNNRLIIWDALREYNALKGTIGFQIRAKSKIDKNFPEMVFVKGGTFQMGSNDGYSEEKPVHTVTVDDFYIGKYEVTVAEFEKFINATNYQTDADKGGNSWVYTNSEWKEEDGVNWRYDAKGDKRPRSDYNHPVIHVSWNDAVAYCNWLKKTTGKAFRLPTEAEWEYAAGGGNKSNGYKWAGINSESSLYRYANFADKNTDFSWATKSQNDNYTYTAPVGEYSPNELGIYDMTGNVWEWCSDWYDSDYYENSPRNNPQGASSGIFRVLRGGSCNIKPNDCRVARRHRNPPTFRSSNIGFRLVFP